MGLIPAHAGKTGRRQCRVLRSPAHPRSRGENLASTMPTWSATGSSPLTRGKRVIVVFGNVEVRLIPAHAGKTPLKNQHTKQNAAHPRSRGENAEVLYVGEDVIGSSPLTRGKPGPTRTLAGSHGLIPAHAGKTVSENRASISIPAHPRSRGENIQPRFRRIRRPGSSPLTRGKLHVRPHVAAIQRLIPAHAGKTACRTRAELSAAAHPRSRGENGYTPGRDVFHFGSSPLTRGKREHEGRRTAKRRLIPAHAGKTRPRRPSRTGSQAHPRSRGENRRGIEPRFILTGSSPLTRGKHRKTRPPSQSLRLIPAHAGKTQVDNTSPC